MNVEELKASGLLLDLGVRIPVRPLRFFRKKLRLIKNIWIRQPYPGGLIRISNLWRQTGLTLEDLKKNSPEDDVRFVAEHGRTAVKIVSCAIVRGYFWHKLFGRLVEWWLLWHVHPTFITDAINQLIENLHTDPFKNTINAAAKINLMRPRLSH